MTDFERTNLFPDRSFTTKGEAGQGCGRINEVFLVILELLLLAAMQSWDGHSVEVKNKQTRMKDSEKIGSFEVLSPLCNSCR